MKKFIKYFSFALLLIPSILLFAGCKKEEPEPKSYAFYVAAEDGIQLTDSNGNLLQNIKKLETEGDSTYYIEVRNDKDAENIKLYLNGSTTATTLTKVSEYNDEVVDGTNYQKVYSFVVPAVTTDTTVKVEGAEEKLITFEFDVLTFGTHYDDKARTIANNVLVENYDSTYDHTETGFKSEKTTTLRDLIDENRKITIPYNRIVDLATGRFENIADLNFLRLSVNGGIKIYMTNNYYSPFKIMAFNTNSTISDTASLGTDQGGNFGLSAVTGTSVSNYLTLNLGNLKTNNLLKKTNVYKLSFASTDYSQFLVDYVSDEKISPFISITTSEGGENTSLKHTYGKTTTVTLTLDQEKLTKAFGANAENFVRKIKIAFDSAEGTSTYNFIESDAVVYTRSFEIATNALPKVAKSFILKYSIENQTAYNISKTIEETIPSDAITVTSTIGEDVSTTLHYAGFETKVVVSIDKSKFDPNFDFTFLGISVNGQDITLTEATTYEVTLATDATPASGDSIVVKAYIKTSDD